MDKRELAIVKAQSEVDMLSKELEGRVATLQYTLENELDKEFGYDSYLSKAEDVRRTLEKLMASKKVLKALEGLE